MSAPRRIATFYLPILIDTLVKAQEAFAGEFPDAVVQVEPGNGHIMHIESGPSLASHPPSENEATK